jgi:hypothetical protein
MKQFIIFLLIISVVSCANKKTEDRSSQILIIQKQTHNGMHTDEGVFSEYFEVESIVPIETQDSFLISTINKVICADDNIIILDNNSCIFVIDSRTGKAKLCIDRKGHGPGESKIICDITFNPVSRNIIALNDFEKILFFDLDGNFLYDEPAKKLYGNIVYDRGNLILYNVGEGYGCHPYFIDIYNIQNKTWIHKGDDKKIEFPFRQYGRQIVKSRQIWFASPLGYQIGKIMEDYELKFPYTLKPENPITPDLIESATSNMSSFFSKTRRDKIIYGVSSIRETDNFLIFKTNIFEFLIMNKNTLTLAGYERLFDRNLGRLANYYPHDGDDNRVMFIFQASEWLMRRAQDVPAHIQFMIDSVKVDEDSNPILVFYKEKNT